MAIIGTIRNNSWILVVLIGVAMAGFIIMSGKTSFNGAGGAGVNDLGKVNGKKITRDQFERSYSLLYGNSTGDQQGKRNYLWNYYKEEAIVSSEGEALGLGVCPEELEELQFGANPSRIIVQRFSNPQAPGQVDRAQLDKIKNLIDNGELETAIASGQLSPSFIQYWGHQQKEIIKDQIQNRLNAMVSKAMYTPTWMAEMGYTEQNERLDLVYVRVPYDEVDNTTLNISDADYQAFLDENKAKYSKNVETRNIDYVVFDVIPTAEDSAEVKQIISEAIPNFSKATNDSTFVARYNGSFDTEYFTAESFSPVVADTIFKMEKGSVFGPYLDGDSYAAVKVVDTKMIPDSVEARHILRPVQSQQEYVQVISLIDSLKNLIETGANTFEELAKEFGTDGTASKGGDLGYAAPGQMVKPFNDLIFYEAEVGKLYTVATQFGLHIVQVTDKKYINNKKGARVAYIREPIVPSKKTRNAVYAKASAFAGQNTDIESFRAGASAAKLKIETARSVEPDGYVVGDLGTEGDGREVVRWAFGDEKGAVSPTVYSFKDATSFYNNKYVVAAVSDVFKPGKPNVAMAKDQIENLVIRKAKGDVLSKEMKGMDMAAAAAKWSVPVDTTRAMNFSSRFVQGLGAEPEVIGRAVVAPVGQEVGPVAGNDGVYIFKVISKPEMPAATNFAAIQKLMMTADRTGLGSKVIEDLTKDAKIEDNRNTFY